MATKAAGLSYDGAFDTSTLHISDGGAKPII